MKFVLAFMAALFVTSFSVCAAELDSDQYYDLDPVQLSPMTSSVLDYGVSLAADASWSTTDSRNLADIRNALTTLTSGTLLRHVYDMHDDLEDILLIDNDVKTILNTISGYLDGVSSNNLADDVYEIRRGISDLYSNISSINANVSELLTHYWNGLWTLRFFDYNDDGVLEFTRSVDVDFASFFSNSLASLTSDSVIYYTGERTLLSRVKQLQQVLASDDDLALAELQKTNREEIENTFLNGSSGSTSLGASDFGDLSDVGGSVKDMLSLDGNASITSFVSGISSADSAGTGWFSEETRSQLDSVTSSASTYSRSDPYNMSGWQDRYYWLIGDDDNG